MISNFWNIERKRYCRNNNLCNHTLLEVTLLIAYNFHTLLEVTLLIAYHFHTLLEVTLLIAYHLLLLCSTPRISCALSTNPRRQRFVVIPNPPKPFNKRRPQLTKPASPI